RVCYEGQAAMELEWLATFTAPDGVYPFDVLEPAANSNVESTFAIDTRPLIKAIGRDSIRAVAAATIARRFHSTVTEMIVAGCNRIRRLSGIQVVVLSGGVFGNTLLLQGSLDALRGAGFEVYRHRLVPPGDGGLCLGQVAIAAAQLVNRKGLPDEKRTL